MRLERLELSLNWLRAKHATLTLQAHKNNQFSKSQVQYDSMFVSSFKDSTTDSEVNQGIFFLYDILVKYLLYLTGNHSGLLLTKTIVPIVPL